MAGPTVQASQFGSLTNASAGAINLILNKLITAVNSSNHDPGDATNGYGKSIPVFGSASDLYAAHGPGSGGTDWFTTYEGKAAIPGIPLATLTNLNPATAVITPDMGIIANIQYLMGCVAKLVTGSYTGSLAGTFPSLVQLSPGSQQTGSINVSGKIQTANQLESDIATGTAPMVIASTTKVTNLNVDQVDGFDAVSTYGAGNNGKLLALNSGGLFDAAAIAYDSAEAATFDTLSGSSTVINNMDRMRYVIEAVNKAAKQSTWQTPPTTLMTSFAAAGNPAIWGDVAFVAGSGIVLGQSGNTVTISQSGSLPAGSGALTYADLFGDGVVSGLTPTNPSGLNVQIATGTGYVGGTRKLMSAATTIAVPAVASTTYYVFWDGTDSAGLSTTTTATHQSGKILLARAVTNGGATAITLTDRRSFGLQAQTPGVPTSTAYGVVNIGGGYFTGQTADSAFSGVAGGTQLAVNAPTGFTGNVIDAQVAGAAAFSVSATGGGMLKRLSVNGGTTGFDGDIGVARSTTTGGIYFDTSGSRSFINDGTNFALSGRPLRVVGNGGIFEGLTTVNRNAATVAGYGDETFHLDQVDGGVNRLLIDSHGASTRSSVTLRRSRGTGASLSAIATDDEIGRVGWAGYGASAYGNVVAAVGGFAAENHTDTAQGTYLVLSATPTGSLTLTEKMRVHGNGISWFGHAIAAQQTVTGSRASGAALADLLTKLANYGLIVDSSTA